MTKPIETSNEFIRRKEMVFRKELEKHIRMKDITRTGFHGWIREAWTFMPQSNYSEKIFIIERMRKAHEDVRRGSKMNEIEYRIGYFVVGKIGNKKGRWTWGQFCPLVPAKDFPKLLEKAKREKTII